MRPSSIAVILNPLKPDWRSAPAISAIHLWFVSIAYFFSMTLILMRVLNVCDESNIYDSKTILRYLRLTYTISQIGCFQILIKIIIVRIYVGLSRITWCALGHPDIHINILDQYSRQFTFKITGNSISTLPKTFCYTISYLNICVTYMNV